MVEMGRLFVFLFLMMPNLALAFSFDVSTPPGVVVSTPYGTVDSKVGLGAHRLELPDHLSGAPVSLELKGPFGGIVRETVYPRVGPSLENHNIVFKSGIVRTKLSNPDYLDILPALCPRVDLQKEGLMYRGEGDILNTTPVLQLMDPDAKFFEDADQTVKAFDCSDVLLVEEVRLSFDYEDPSLRNAVSPSGEIYAEDRSGFYANFHVAVLPDGEALRALSPEDLLRVAEGKASERGVPLAPEWQWRTHSFLPGPFLSRRDFLYAMCEWGDTAKQAPHQALHYQNLGIFDWDYPGVGEKLLIVVWEGDEEAALIDDGVLLMGAIADDLVAVFAVSKEEAKGGVTFTNPEGTFEMRVKTGEMSECR